MSYEHEFESRPKTEVYLNGAGRIVIKQTYDDGNEHHVVFDHEQIDSLVSWLEEARAERLSDEWQPDPSVVYGE